MKKLRYLIPIFLFAFALVLLQTGCQNKQEESQKAQSVSVNVAALKGPTAMGMVKLMSDAEGGNTDSGNSYQFTIAASPDEIVPKLVKGEVDIAAVPANLASILYQNTGGKVEVLAINTLGVLYIVENGEEIHSVSDLKGKTIYASGKGSTPEYALNYMLEANGIDKTKDVTIEYKSEHSEVVAALAADATAVAMLPQPFVAAAQAQNDKIRIALDLTKEWENAQNEAALITGVVVAGKDFIDNNPEAVKNFLKEYESSVDFVNENPDEAAALIGSYDIVTEEVAKKALPYCNITFISGEEMKTKLSSYLTVLSGQSSEAVGGALPGDDFYYEED